MRQEHQDGVTYLLRNILKANWMKLHRILTMMLVVSLVIHIFQMGIKLPYAISSLGKSAGSSKTEQLKIEEENDTLEEPGKIEEIEENQKEEDSDNVVTFSGATYSSKGIQNAVCDALQNAVISGELKITDIQISNGHGHGKPHHCPVHKMNARASVIHKNHWRSFVDNFVE